jgi:DNA-binding transcriptional regulator GbsR (MarR family)
MCSEMRRATVDLLRGDKPSSVLGILMANRESDVTVEEMADQLGRPVGAVAWTIEKLEEEDLCERISHDGVTRVVAFAAFSARNAV